MQEHRAAGWWRSSPPWAVRSRSPSAAQAQAPIVIKFSHVVANDTPKGKAAEFFAKRAAELTKGKVKVEVYANRPLYKDKEEMEALQLGAVQMLAPSLAKFGPLGVKEFEVFDLPFIFDDTAELHKVTAGPGRQAAARQARAPRASRAWRYWDNGFKSFSAQQAAQDAGRLQGPEDAHPVVEGARGADARARRAAAGDGVLRGLPGAADRRRRRHREPALEPLHAEDARGAEVRDACPTTATSATRSSSTRSSGTACRPTCAAQLEQAMKEATDYANKIAQEGERRRARAVKKSGKTRSSC